MLWLAAATMIAGAVAEVPSAPTRVSAQATATVRIVSAVRLKLDSAQNDGAPAARSTIFVSNGTAQPARLIEFE